MAAVRGTREWLAALEGRERERTGIRSLKVGFNKVFGYYIEVTRPNLGLVPAEYARKQTVANGERYVTAAAEGGRGAHPGRRRGDRRAASGRRWRGSARWSRRRPGGSWRTAARPGRARRAAGAGRGRRPQRLDRAGRGRERRAARSSAGRHPVVEAHLGGEPFIPNDCHLGGEGPRQAIVTGPNMGGKSTYLRQTALIVLLAQIGSLVPAARARIGLVDRIFTRVGAQDDLARGQSTFMIEMVETAAILHQATDALAADPGRGRPRHRHRRRAGHRAGRAGGHQPPHRGAGALRHPLPGADRRRARSCRA